MLTILQGVNFSGGSQLLAKETTGWDSRAGDQFAEQAMQAMPLCFTSLYSKELHRVWSIKEHNTVESKAVEQEKEKFLGAGKQKKVKFHFEDSRVTFTMIHVPLCLL